jgi:hypothetical protein
MKAVGGFSGVSKAVNHFNYNWIEMKKLPGDRDDFPEFGAVFH